MKPKTIHKSIENKGKKKLKKMQENNNKQLTNCKGQNPFNFIFKEYSVLFVESQIHCSQKKKNYFNTK